MYTDAEKLWKKESTARWRAVGATDPNYMSKAFQQGSGLFLLPQHWLDNSGKWLRGQKEPTTWKAMAAFNAAFEVFIRENDLKISIRCKQVNKTDGVYQRLSALAQSLNAPGPSKEAGRITRSAALWTVSEKTPDDAAELCALLKSFIQSPKDSSFKEFVDQAPRWMTQN
jgi:hypothetical protein